MYDIRKAYSAFLMECMVEFPMEFMVASQDNNKMQVKVRNDTQHQPQEANEGQTNDDAPPTTRLVEEVGETEATMIHKNESHQWQIVTRNRGKKLENTKPSAAEQQSCAQRLLHDEIEEQSSGNFKSSTLTMERPVQQSDMDNSIEAAIKRLSNLPLLDIKK
ncbi:hypothetical protein SLEP1_g12090 [Rubroshorea leprosula]|nr:hypothetical protein SLEP1_g12090 [Rubroshorea leprosula]